MITRMTCSLRASQNSPAIFRMLATSPSLQNHPGGSHSFANSGSSISFEGSTNRSNSMASWSSSGASLLSPLAGTGTGTVGTSYCSHTSSTMPCTTSACVDGWGFCSSSGAGGWSTAMKYGVSEATMPSPAKLTCRTRRPRSRACTVGMRFVPGVRITCSWMPRQASLNRGHKVSSPFPYNTPPATMRPFTVEPSLLKQFMTKSSISFHCSYLEPLTGVRSAYSASERKPSSACGVVPAQTITEEMSTKIMSRPSSSNCLGGLAVGSTFSALIAKCRSSIVQLKRSMTTSPQDWMVSAIFLARLGSSRPTTLFTAFGTFSGPEREVPNMRLKLRSSLGPNMRSSLTIAFPKKVSAL
mmetsp:Transcript_126212/g.351668  ORF Transcript_126212/g.351668 Transcript_126212/m.351668 type:complete len:356 (+) Transcript_126212:289-1356(+)